jgi:hypothetical protein
LLRRSLQSVTDIAIIQHFAASQTDGANAKMSRL